MEIIRQTVEHWLLSLGVGEELIHALALLTIVSVAALLAWLADALSIKLVVPAVKKLTLKTKATWDDIVLNEHVVRAACHIAPAIVVWILMPAIFSESAKTSEMVGRLTATYFTIACLNLLLRILDSFKNLQPNGRSTLRQYVLSFCGVLKIVAIFCAIIVSVAILLGKNPATLFAGLGATSAILMLVFKDTIEGLVAGIRLTSADMLLVGDWITVPSAGADGIVTEMTLTTVKIQNFDNTIVTISPMTLVNGSFRNWKGMQQSAGRCVQRTIYIDVRSLKMADDKQQRTNLALFRADMEQWLRKNPLVNPEMTLMVRDLQPTQQGLPVELYFFLREKEWVKFEHQVAHILEYAITLAQSHGLRLFQQFPNQIVTDNE